MHAQPHHHIKPGNEPTLAANSTNVTDFFTRIELWFDLAHIRDDAERIKRAVLNVKSSTITTQWFSHANTLSHPPTWEYFKEKINVYARGHAARAKALDSLSSCVQGTGTIDSYIARYNRLVADAGLPLTDVQVIKGFLRGISDSTLRTVLARTSDHNPWTSLDALTDAASNLVVDGGIGRRPKQQQNTNPRSSHAKTGVTGRDKPRHDKDKSHGAAAAQHRGRGRGFKRRGGSSNKGRGGAGAIRNMVQDEFRKLHAANSVRHTDRGRGRGKGRGRGGGRHGGDYGAPADYYGYDDSQYFHEGGYGAAGPAPKYQRRDDDADAGAAAGGSRY